MPVTLLVLVVPCCRRLSLGMRALSPGMLSARMFLLARSCGACVL
jgi:hypothetical protein